MNTKSKVTYLIGAGASAQALPTIKKTIFRDSLADSFKALATKLSAKYILSEEKPINGLLSIFISNLNWLSENTKKFGTPDTFAKFLFLQGSINDLNRLKDTLSAYFVIEQFKDNKFDQRTLIFLTSILDQLLRLPENIKILTWNYDFQLQIAAEVFRKESITLNRSQFAHTPSLINYFPSFDDRSMKNEYDLIHLNGIAGSFAYENWRLNYMIDNEKIKKDYEQILAAMNTDKKNKINLLTFAWEKHYLQQDALNHAKNAVKNTDVLVVIGYSFPFFNREVDNEIINEIKSSGKLKIIYFQDISLTGDFMYNQFEIDKEKVVIKHISEVEQYYIPLEL